MKFWSTKEVEDLLKFGCDDLFGASEAMVILQRDGVAALTSILRRNGIAYLADEVGLGKTMQALGVIACLYAEKPEARVLVITPREMVQNGWSTEYQKFTSHVLREPVPGLTPGPYSGLEVYGSLKDWLCKLPVQRGIALLRHPSFTRPVFDADVSWQTVVEKLAAELPLIDTFPKDVLPAAGQERGSAYNQAFALAVNRWLVREQVYFDLVVVDEAQCLRNLEGQQTNTVLQTLLRQRARHWLFISATPAHSGVANIATVLNSYAEHRGRVPIPRELLQREDDYLALQKRLREFMIRRPRTFLIKGETVRKQQYRRDDTESLALDCTDPLGILSIGLVQKKLVKILGSARNPNTFRSGYVASFESLEDSVQHRQLVTASKQREQGEEQAETDVGDFYTDRHVRHEESRAPDEGFVSEMNRDFSGRFGFSLPHPKLDAVEQDLATRAFGSRAQIAVGGQKTVVFCRRVSSVRVLRERLLHRYLASIKDRCRSYWKMELDWKHGLPDDRRQPIEPVADAPEDDAQIGVGAEDHRNLLRAAQSEGQWLVSVPRTHLSSLR